MSAAPQIDNPVSDRAFAAVVQRAGTLAYLEANGGAEHGAAVPVKVAVDAFVTAPPARQLALVGTAICEAWDSDEWGAASESVLGRLLLDFHVDLRDAAAQVHARRVSDSELATVLRLGAARAWLLDRGIEAEDDEVPVPVAPAVEALLGLAPERQWLIVEFYVGHCSKGTAADTASHLRGVLWRLRTEFGIDLSEEAARAAREAALEVGSE